MSADDGAYWRYLGYKSDDDDEDGKNNCIGFVTFRVMFLISLVLLYSFLTGPEEYKLSISRPWKNPYWIVAVVSSNNVIGTKIVNSLKIMFPIPDPVMFSDATTKKKISAVLMKGGRGMEITIPSMCTCMSAPASVGIVHGQESQVDEAATLEHTILSAEYMRGDRDIQYKKIILQFPGGMSCTTRHFNSDDDDDESQKLKTKFWLGAVKTEHHKDDDGLIQMLTPFVWWKLAIKSRARSIKTVQDSDSDDDGKAAFKRMGNLKMGWTYYEIILF